MDAATDRLARQAFQFWLGDRVNPVRWLESLGCKIRAHPDGTVIVTGLTGMTCGLPDAGSDPITCGVQFGFATAGPFWPQAYPGYQKRVGDLWKAYRKKYLTQT